MWLLVAAPAVDPLGSATSADGPAGRHQQSTKSQSVESKKMIFVRRINETTAGKYNGKHLLRHLFLSSHAGEANPLQTNVAVLFLSESDRVILQRFFFFFYVLFSLQRKSSPLIPTWGAIKAKQGRSIGLTAMGAPLEDNAITTLCK